MHTKICHHVHVQSYITELVPTSPSHGHFQHSVTINKSSTTYVQYKIAIDITHSTICGVYCREGYYTSSVIFCRYRLWYKCTYCSIQTRETRWSLFFSAPSLTLHPPSYLHMNILVWAQLLERNVTRPSSDIVMRDWLVRLHIHNDTWTQWDEETHRKSGRDRGRVVHGHTTLGQFLWCSVIRSHLSSMTPPSPKLHYCTPHTSMSCLSTSKDCY